MNKHSKLLQREKDRKFLLAAFTKRINAPIFFFFIPRSRKLWHVYSNVECRDWVRRVCGLALSGSRIAVKRHSHSAGCGLCCCCKPPPWRLCFFVVVALLGAALPTIDKPEPSFSIALDCFFLFLKTKVQSCGLVCTCSSTMSWNSNLEVESKNCFYDNDNEISRSLNN